MVWAAHRALALPSAPETVWASVPGSLDIKPWANPHLRADEQSPSVGSQVNAWFRRPDRSCPVAWDSTLEIELLCETPFVRRAVLGVLMACGRKRYATHESVFAVYRNAGETQIVGETTWARYELEE